jgi:hypothetical protein
VLGLKVRIHREQAETLLLDLESSLNLAWQVAELLLSKMVQTGPLQGSGPMGERSVLKEIEQILVEPVFMCIGQTVWGSLIYN